ncbi:sulfate/molybdate ABC transporter ATP-binding protein [Pseudoclavibacter endophyticus]|nr:ABC transporter ATP-binding protein [Pseudoclavibacter endophyticus]
MADRPPSPAPAAGTKRETRSGAHRPPKRFELRASVRERDVDVELEVAAGETVALLGPNGAGKSTLLALAAGLIAADSGQARLGDRVLFEVDAGGRRRARRPHERGVALLAQEALLFPNLTARDNVAFGPRSRGTTRREARRVADEWLGRVGAAELADRKPAELSGGQAQRIAVARALAGDPELLLLDEPMAALDASVVPALRRLLRDALAGRTTIIVTHDALDAVTLADRVALIEDGRVVDSGRTRDVLERPTTPFAARLAGLNLLVGTLEAGGAVRTDTGDLLRAAPSAGAEGSAPGSRVGVAVRPSRVAVWSDPPASAFASTSGENAISGIVNDLEPRDDGIRIHAGAIAADVSPSVVADLDLEPGTWARFTFAEADATYFPL